MGEVLVLTFVSHYDAMCAKTFFKSSEIGKAFSNEGEHFSLSPTPRRISSTCATCLLGDNEAIALQAERPDLFLSLDGLEGIYLLKKDKKEVIYEH